MCGCAQVELRLESHPSGHVSPFSCGSGRHPPTLHLSRAGHQWLDDRFADRAWLGVNGHGLSDEESGLIRDPAAVHRVPPFAIVLLKGELWPGNAGQGLIHRSPALLADEAPRVLVALDAV